MYRASEAVTAAWQAECTSTDGCKDEAGHYLLRLDYAEAQRLRAAGVNVFMDGTRCSAYPGIYHVRGFHL